MHTVTHGALLSALPTAYLPVGLAPQSPHLPLEQAQHSTSTTAAALAALAAAATGAGTNTKDSRWLTLEVCRQFQRKMCSRDENECKFAHPPTQVDVQNGRVTCCYDSIKGKCRRKDPPCKYFHPPQHLREQLLQNGRNNLIMKSMQLQLFQQQFLAQGGMLPITCATQPIVSVATANGACPQSGSSTSSGNVVPTGRKILYPSAGPMNLPTHGRTTAYSLLGIGLTPYLSAVAASPINSIVAATATLNASKSVQNGLTQLGLAPGLASVPAKRLALADAESELPIFHNELARLASTPAGQHASQSGPACTASTPATLYSLQGASIAYECLAGNPNQTHLNTNLGMDTSLSSNQMAQLDDAVHHVSFYPQPYIGIAQYGYPQ